MKSLKLQCRLLLVLLLIGLLAGCSNTPSNEPAAPSEPAAPNEPADTEKPADTEVPKKIGSVEFITGSATGSWVPIASGISQKINEYYDGFPVTSVPGPGSLGNPPVIGSGDSDIGMSYAPFLIAAVAGKAPYEEAYPNLRAVCAMQPNVLHFIADVDDSVTSVQQLIDEKVKMTLGIPPVGNASTYLVQTIFTAMGYDNLEDIKDYGSNVYYGDTTSINDAWSNRQINAFVSTLNIPASSVQESLVGRGGKILSIDDKLAEVLIKNEGYNSYTIPAGTYSGQEEDVETVALPLVVFVSEEMDEEFVYNLTKSIYENKEYFETVHSSYVEFDPEKMTEGIGIELHSGAVKFYKEVGLQ